MITGQDCERALEEHRRLNNWCSAEHILREAFGRLLAERNAYRELAIKLVFVEPKYHPERIDQSAAKTIDVETQKLLDKERYHA